MLNLLVLEKVVLIGETKQLGLNCLEHIARIAWRHTGSLAQGLSLRQLDWLCNLGLLLFSFGLIRVLLLAGLRSQHCSYLLLLTGVGPEAD